jgi:protein arginine N-methyltransferase 3
MLDIHETMLKDTVRTDAYRDFIYENKHLFAGKTVLDVGCGTGILSMFCARAGAAKVIAVDNSNIIDKARTNIHANGLSDVITCLRGKIEEVNLPIQKVDIIVSEWMGYCLLFEAMLDSVLWARDKYLAHDGLMVPSHCVLHVAPIEDQDYLVENVDFWRDVYGFNMTAMMEKIYDDILVRQLPSKNVAAKSAPFLTLPLHDITTADLSFVKSFSVEVSKDLDALDGWVIWFDTFFLTSREAVLPEDARAETWPSGNNNGVAFTTGPAGKETHWRSGVMLIDRSKNAGVPVKAGTRIEGSVEYKKGKENVRNLEIELKWESESQLWFMH